MCPASETSLGELSGWQPAKHRHAARQATPEGYHSSTLLEARQSLSSLTGDLSACRFAESRHNLHLSDIAELLALPPC